KPLKSGAEVGKGCCWIGQNTLISVYGITVLTQRKHCNLELSTTSSLFLVLDRAIRECFPKLLRLDGQELPSPVTVDVDTPYIVKLCKGSYFGSDELKSLVLQFLKQYYLIHDYGDRQVLAGAYHEEACFSLTIPFHPEDPAPSSLCEYFKDSRNMKKLKDPCEPAGPAAEAHKTCHCAHPLCVAQDSACLQLLRGGHVVPDGERLLPPSRGPRKPQESMLCFSVCGVFKAVAGSSQGCLRAFTRTFIATPARDCSLCIVNDELYVRDADPSETQSVFSIPLPTPTSSSMHPLSQQQQDIMQASSTPSEMNR
ncbi:nuclear RNA export factor 2-like, partial [Orcinus orca]|uniref:nuclear RNA export factor 2-like n=1 Tax=Orcinus orca TaxID=9733 RepID=UPI002110E73E